MGSWVFRSALRTAQSLGWWWGAQPGWALYLKHPSEVIVSSQRHPLLQPSPWLSRSRAPGRLVRRGAQSPSEWASRPESAWESTELLRPPQSEGGGRPCRSDSSEDGAARPSAAGRGPAHSRVYLPSLDPSASPWAGTRGVDRGPGRARAALPVSRWACLGSGPPLCSGVHIQRFE